MSTHNIIRKGTIREREINLCLGESTGENAVTSIRVAYEIATANPREGVLFINTFQAGWKFDEACCEAVGPEFVKQAGKKFAVVNSQIGELPSKSGLIQSFLGESQLNIRTIVINSWEYASKNSVTRERMLFLLMRWAMEMDITVLVFAQQCGEREHVVGRYERGGMGKLMGLVARVVKFAREEPAEAEPMLTVRLDAPDEDAGELVEAVPAVPPVRTGPAVSRYIEAIAA